MVLHTPTFYSLDIPFVDLNYGTIRVTEKGVDLSIKNYEGKQVQSLSLTYD